LKKRVPIQEGGNFDRALLEKKETKKKKRGPFMKRERAFLEKKSSMQEGPFFPKKKSRAKRKKRVL